MLLDDKYIKIKWAAKTKTYYENKGYTFTKFGNEFNCKVSDISKGSKYKVPFKCNNCGNIFYKYIYAKNQNGIDYCSRSCSANAQHQKTQDIRKESAYQKLQLFCEYKGYNLLSSKNDYKNTSTKIKYECPIHGLQTGTVGNMVAGHGCIQCQYDIIRLTYEEIENTVNSFNNNKLLNIYMANNKNRDYGLNIQCGICGNSFNITYKGYVSSMHKKCPTCSKSASGYEMIIRDILNKNNIDFLSEYSFEDCKDILPLHFDFYLSLYNLCIEYDGEYHFKPLRISKEETEEDIQKRFMDIKKRDQIKDNYCKTHGINLLRIPYWEKENIETLILDKIKKIKTQVA